MWRFLQISDPHLGSYTDGRWNNNFICTMMPDVMRCLRRDLREIKPDFILATGDLASRPTRDAVFAARDFIDWLGYPYYPMGGNHDFVVEQSRDWFREAFHAHLPGGRTHYSFSHKGLHFAVLDPMWLWADGSLMPYPAPKISGSAQGRVNRGHWVVPVEQLAWLDADLGVHEAQPAIVACHYPAIAIPERMTRPGMSNAGHLENGNEVIALLKRHENVRAVISGHLHMNIVEQVNGVIHMVTASLPEYPVEYREIAVHDDRMEITTRGLSDPSFAARSLVDNNTWTAGEARDRSVTIPLT
jgi:3',5'-cyclic AMP phosphodiesterase CpdA